MRNQNLVLLMLMGLSLFIEISNGADDLSSQCNDSVEKLMTCLTYASGKATAPTDQCCTSVKGIKDSKPKCLCFIMQQVNSGNKGLKGIGIEPSKMLNLPNACQLKNASVADCPKLLGISPSSPDAAIFTNSSSSTTASPTTPKSTSSTPAASKNSSTKNGSHLFASVMAIIVTYTLIVLSGLPAEFVSM
ncbi:hypothetical protein ACFE04_013293 [Oxalis oulophora]